MIEAITIYLAAGAPFGVSYFLRSHNEVSLSSLLRASSAALVWPLAAIIIMRHRRRRNQADTISGMTHSAPDEEEKIERARRQLFKALHKVEELARALSPGEGQRIELVAFVVRESVEKYVGLKLRVEDVSADAPPSEREMELCRIAGRAGDDLLLAGRCIHRRNVARILAHKERARTNLLHALAEVRELTGEASLYKNLAASRHTSVAILRFYGHAINLLSLLEDQGAAQDVARLLDAECARLRRLKDGGLNRATVGEEKCRPHIPPLAFIGPSQTRTLPQG